MSIELTTVKECTQQLETALLCLDSELLIFLNKEGFINNQNYDKIRNPSSHLTEKEKAGQLVKWIINRIEQEESEFHKLMNWFNENGKLFCPISDTLKKEYEKQQLMKNGEYIIMCNFLASN